MNLGLNPNHKRSLVAALSIIDQMMEETLKELNQEGTAVFENHTRKPPPWEKAGIERQIASVKEFLKHLKDKYELKTSTKDIQWLIQVRKSRAIELITDLSPQRLKAGGYLSTETAQNLSHDLEQLRLRIEQL